MPKRRSLGFRLSLLSTTMANAIIEGKEGQMGAAEAEAKENETDEEAAAE